MTYIIHIQINNSACESQSDSRAWTKKYIYNYFLYYLRLFSLSKVLFIDLILYALITNMRDNYVKAEAECGESLLFKSHLGTQVR